MPPSGLWEMFEGDFADMCDGKFILVSMGGRACAKRVQKFLILYALIYFFNLLKNKSLTEICTPQTAHMGPPNAIYKLYFHGPTCH